MKKIISDIFLFIVLFIILVNLYVMLDLSIFGIRFIRVNQNNMQPYLVENDYIVIIKPKEYNLNNVIMYRDEKNNIDTSRIIHIGNEGYTTKYDSSINLNKPIRKENIIGKVLIRFRILGRLLYLFSDIVMMILLFIIVIVIGVFNPAEKIKPEEKKKKGKFIKNYK